MPIMPVPATLTSYLPVLLVSVTSSAVPDDTSYSTLPEGQVDYLSHEWREEDVWRSWRSMTRQKNAIANGTRLENASWRTWWKQRNKLKTISPETLNWLKDSDVTWLYGPLHVGADWSPTASHSPDPHALQPKQRQNSMSAIHAPATTSARKHPAPVTQPKKPILKRRSISQLLSLPASPWFEQIESDEDDIPAVENGENDSPKRPPLLHTKSDTHISLRGRAHRKDSPPRIIAQEAEAEAAAAAATLTTARDASVASGTTSGSSDVSHSTNSDPDLSGGSSMGGESPASSDPSLKKKHISFNTFVEQCIAIEKPNVKRQATGPHLSPMSSSEDGYDEDSEVMNEEEDEEPMAYYRSRQSVMNSDSDEDDDDDVLEMRTASSRSRTSSSASSLPRKLLLAVDVPHTPHPHARPPLVRRSSSTAEHVTIAPIAPTLLKSTGFGNDIPSPGLPIPVTKEVELVYAPPSNSNYSLPSSPSMNHEDVYRHRESYFSVGTSPSPQRSPLASPPIATVNALPPPPQLSASPPKYDSAVHNYFPHQTYADSPMHMDTVVEDAMDYFDGPPVLNENYSPDWSKQHDGTDHPKVVAGAVPARYAEGGAASVQVGRSSGLSESLPDYSFAQSPETPVVVVNEVNGATEERTERSREPSPSQIGSDDSIHPPTFVHTAPVAVPRVGTNHPQISFSPHVADATLLSPSASPCRGRQPASPTCGSVSGSTTTGSSSYSRSTDSRSESRGRSLTRSASLSDRERSNSRGTSSPMGSLSPTGSALAIGAVASGVYVKGRERGRRMGSDEGDRGRDRRGRALAASVSPPGVVNSPTREGHESSAAVLMEVPQVRRESSPPSSVSGSSTASSTTARPTQAQDAVNSAAPRPRIAVSAGPSVPLPIPSPIPEEDEQRRSSFPTPANSPVVPLKTSIPPSTKPEPQPKLPVVTPPVKSEPQPRPTTLTSTSHAEGEISTTMATATATSPIAIPRKDRTPRTSLEGQQDATFVGRAADMMSSARGLLGSIWNTSAA